MVNYMLMITSDLENLTNLQPQDGCDDTNFPYLFKVKCGRCGEVSQKETCVTLNETVPLPVGKGTTNLIQKCKFCGRDGTVTMIPGRGKPLNQEISESGKYAPLMLFDCRGFEPVDFVFGGGWKVESIEGTMFENVDLSSGEFAEYDGKGECPAMISNVRSTFDVVKNTFIVNSFIQALAAEVRQTTQSLLSQLLQRLRSNIQLPECLRIICYLCRIGVFSEYEMRLQFLRCREAWLTGILEDLDQTNPYEYLKGMINCQRMHLFDVVNQYRAIFADETSGSEANYDGGLLFSWAMHQITSHLQTLKVMLPKITEGGSLSNILDQCMYCAMGLGWVGLDFRGLLPSLFEEAVLNLFLKNMSTAVENFQLVLDSHRWVPLPAVGFPTNTVGEETQEDVTPPSYLMEHPPLAVFINGVSAAMNELRPCAPISLKHIIAQELIKGLQAVSDSLMRYKTSRVLRENESGLFLSLGRAFIEVAYPYCATCLGRCYPGGGALIMDAKNLYDGISRLLEASSARELPTPVTNKVKSPAENGVLPTPENGETPDDKQTEVINADEKEIKSPTSPTDTTNLEKVAS